MATMKKEKGILHGERLDDSTKSKFEYWYWTKVIKQSMLTIKLYGKEQWTMKRANRDFDERNNNEKGLKNKRKKILPKWLFFYLGDQYI